MDEIIKFIGRCVKLTVKGRWPTFWGGYFGVVIAMALIGLCVVHLARPVEEVFKKLGEGNALLPWCCLVLFGLASAGVVLAFGMKAYLMTLPPGHLRPLWEAKLRILYKFKGALLDHGARLRERQQYTPTSPTMDPIGEFKSDIHWHFSKLSNDVCLSKDIACDGGLSIPLDKDCHAILTRMDNLQQLGVKILTSIPDSPTGSPDQRIETALALLGGTLNAVQEVVDECTEIMKRKGLD